jgi:hypothetical protein
MGGRSGWIPSQAMATALYERNILERNVNSICYSEFIKSIFVNFLKISVNLLNNYSPNKFTNLLKISGNLLKYCGSFLTNLLHGEAEFKCSKYNDHWVIFQPTSAEYLLYLRKKVSF